MLKRLLLISIGIFFITSIFAQSNSLAFTTDNNAKTEVKITFKPNPIKSTAQVDITGLNADRYKFFIFDITGRLIRQYAQQYQNSFVFEREDLEKGFYLYKLITPSNDVIAGRFQVVD